MSQLSFFNSEKAEYFFLISPDKEGIQKVKHLKNLVHSSFTISEEDLVSVPHITLFKIHLYEENEHEYLASTSKILNSFQSCMIESLGIGFFKHPMASTHFVRVSNSDLIVKIGQALYSNFKKTKLQLNPHITVTKMMPLNQHDAIQKTLHDNYKPFSFLLDRVLVLKRRRSEKRYEVVGEVFLRVG